MPITTLDPRSALIVIDLQEGILALAKVHPHDAIVKNAIRIIHTSREKNGVTKIFPRLGETGTTEEIISLFEVRS